MYFVARTSFLSSSLGDELDCTPQEERGESDGRVERELCVVGLLCSGQVLVYCSP